MISEIFMATFSELLFAYIVFTSLTLIHA